LIGKLNLNIAPFPSELFSAHIFPPLASIILLYINSPNPVPLSDFVTNFENNLGKISGVRKNNRIQSEYQICARIMQARIKLERNEVFTKWLKSYKVVVL